MNVEILEDSVLEAVDVMTRMGQAPSSSHIYGFLTARGLDLDLSTLEGTLNNMVEERLLNRLRLDLVQGNSYLVFTIPIEESVGEPRLSIV